MESDNCLIIATYNGNYKNSVRLPNPVNFNNVKSVLENINHNLFSKIIISISEEKESQYINIEYDKYLRSIEETEKLKLIRKPNDAYLSYSSYYEGYKAHPSHQYYFFIEDDYIVTDKYVEIAIKEMNRHEWDYIFGDINYHPSVILHACHCLCVAKGSALKTVFNNFYSNMDSVSNKYNVVHQMSFFKIFKESGLKGEDFKNSGHSLMFWTTRTHTYLFYSNNGLPNLVYPIQYYYYYKHTYPNNKAFDEYLLDKT